MTNAEFKRLVEALATAMLNKAPSKPRSVRRSKTKPVLSGSMQVRVAPKWDVDAAAKAAAAKAGFDATPRVDLLTAKAWAEKGMFPKGGTAAVRVKKPGSKGPGMPLFHASQVEARV